MDDRKDVTREVWLKEATLLIEKQILSKHNIKLPENWTVSVGFPAGSPKAIGQAWDKESCDDKKTYSLFISPVLGNQDKVNLLQVLLHEIIHIAVGIDQKHGGEFKRVARLVGLEGRLTATYVSESNPLHAQLENVYNDVGWAYPHEVLLPKFKPKKERQSNILQLVSPSDSEYIIKMKKDIFENEGAPFDRNGEEMIVVEE